MNKYAKTIVKEFRSCLGRFVAITAIIAVGVGFMIGITQTTPDMKYSMDAYFAASNAYDVNVKAVYGLSADDITAIEDMTYTCGKTTTALCQSVMPYISTDCVAEVSGEGASYSLAARVNGVNFETLSGDGGVNKLTLESGRMPESDDECVVQRSNTNFKNVTVGSVISLSGEGTLDYGGATVYTQKTFTVVGVVSSPEYYYLDAQEITTVGTGVIGAVIYVNEGIYNLSANPLYAMTGAVYTDAAIILNGSDAYTVFTDDYEDFVKERTSAFATLGSERCQSINALLSQYSAELTAAQWYSLDIVSANPSYVGFSMNADKVTAIAAIFPVFFIVVAALVALTSMTRMIEEERPQIGTLKALGYSNGAVISKYLIYCCAASLIGCLLGALAGFSLLPTIIWEAYKVLYYLPSLTLSFSPLFAAAVLAVALLLTVGVTLYASVPTFREKPSALMTPKAPKAGKRILLERCGFVWNRLKFKHKATLRNLFRYKKNMFMTVISVMGCTALIFVGFALSNSISETVDLQFTQITGYDITINYDQITAGGELESFINENSYCTLFSEDGTVVFDSDKSGSQTATLYAVSAGSDVYNFIDIRESSKSGALDLSGGGVAICKNYAKAYGVDIGDDFIYRRTDGTELTLTVTAIAENYFGGCVYIDAALLSSLISDGQNNTILVKISDYDKEQLSQTLYSDGGVTSVTFTSDTENMYSGLESIMGYIIAVLVVSAGALAAIVLYNLTNINIEERRKEIATLKVLGYTRAEVAGYIYRESAVNTVAGSLLGLGLGTGLNAYVVSRINGAAVMFANITGVASYFISLGLTLAFAAIVYAFMTIKLNKIDMADSLKSNE